MNYCPAHGEITTTSGLCARCQPNAPVPGTGVVFMSDMVEDNGRTVRENNMELRHAIPLDALVEVRHGPDDENEHDGIRLYVVAHERDCDGTPLYRLGVRGHRISKDESYPWLSLRKTVGGFSDNSLIVIAPPPSTPGETK